MRKILILDFHMQILKSQNYVDLISSLKFVHLFLCIASWEIIQSNI